MVIKRSTSAEVARLIGALIGADPVAREAAAARLAIVGPRAVDRLTATLEGLRDPGKVVAVLDVLERIADARASVAARALLSDAREPVAIAAVSVVRRSLQSVDPEVAAEAADALMAIAGDEARAGGIRRAAGEALGDLPDELVAPLRRRWPQVFEAPLDSRERDVAATSAGAADRDWLDRWLDQAEPGTPARVREAVQTASAELPLARLHHAVERLRALERAAAPDDVGDWRATRGIVHQALAAQGSTVALYDLREQLEGAPDRLTVAMLAALGAVGDASCLEPLASAWARTTDAWIRAQLAEAFDAIVQREGLTRRHAPLRRVASQHPGFLEAVSRLSRTTPSRRRAHRT